jgi:flagellar biosynthetic protein FliP
MTSKSASPKFFYVSATLLLLLFLFPVHSFAIGVPNITFGVDDAQNPKQISTALQVLFLLTVLSVTPAILLMMTCFTRIIIVLGFVRQAMGTTNMPPTQVLLGLALFLSFFIMAPTFNRINDEALQPYLKETISQEAAFNKALTPMRDFMFSQVKEDELALLTDITMKTAPGKKEDVPTMTLSLRLSSPSSSDHLKWGFSSTFHFSSST